MYGEIFIHYLNQNILNEIVSNQLQYMLSSERKMQKNTWINYDG